MTRYDEPATNTVAPRLHEEALERLHFIDEPAENISLVSDSAIRDTQEDNSIISIRGESDESNGQYTPPSQASGASTDDDASLPGLVEFENVPKLADTSTPDRTRRTRCKFDNLTDDFSNFDIHTDIFGAPENSALEDREFRLLLSGDANLISSNSNFGPPGGSKPKNSSSSEMAEQSQDDVAETNRASEASGVDNASLPDLVEGENIPEPVAVTAPRTSREPFEVQYRRAWKDAKRLAVNSSESVAIASLYNGENYPYPEAGIASIEAHKKPRNGPTDRFHGQEVKAHGGRDYGQYDMASRRDETNDSQEQHAGGIDGRDHGNRVHDGQVNSRNGGSRSAARVYGHHADHGHEHRHHPRTENAHHSAGSRQHGHHVDNGYTHRYQPRANNVNNDPEAGAHGHRPSRATMAEPSTRHDHSLRHRDRVGHRQAPNTARNMASRSSSTVTHQERIRNNQQRGQHRATTNDSASNNRYTAGARPAELGRASVRSVDESLWSPWARGIGFGRFVHNVAPVQAKAILDEELLWAPTWAKGHWASMDEMTERIRRGDDWP